MNTSKIIIPNGLTHAVLCSYFEHGFMIYMGSLKKTERESLSSSDLTLQLGTYLSLIFQLRGNSLLGPNAIAGIAALFGPNKTYPMEIEIRDQEKIWFDRIARMSFSTIEKNLKKAVRQSSKKDTYDTKFKSLMNVARTPEAVDYIMDKFRRLNYRSFKIG